jgi:hypothetical protein
MEYCLRRFDVEYRWLVDTRVPRFTLGGLEVVRHCAQTGV